MAFITKKHLSRRTFLQGAGVTMALPFLESMVPAATPLRQTAAGEDRTRRHLCSARRDHGQVDAGERGRRFRVHRDPAAAEAVPRQRQRDQRSEPSAGLWRRSATVESQPLRRGVSERRQCRSRAAGAARRHGGPAGGAADRTGHAAALARADDRGLEPELRRRSELRLPQHDFVAGSDLAAADAEQPAGRLRAAVRRRQHRRRAARAPRSSR